EALGDLAYSLQVRHQALEQAYLLGTELTGSPVPDDRAPDDLFRIALQHRTEHAMHSMMPAEVATRLALFELLLRKQLRTHDCFTHWSMKRCSNPRVDAPIVLRVLTLELGSPPHPALGKPRDRAFVLAGDAGCCGGETLPQQVQKRLPLLWF